MSFLEVNVSESLRLMMLGNNTKRIDICLPSCLCCTYCFVSGTHPSAEPIRGFPKLRHLVSLSSVPGFELRREAGDGKLNLESLRSYLRSYNPPRECVGGYLNILLFGLVGAGKSSTINTFFSALDREGRTANIAPWSSSDRSFTPELWSFTPETLKFRFWDAPGLSSKDYEKNAEKILTMILDGRLPPGTKIKDLDPDLECKYPVTEENKIHGVAFVFNLETVDNLSADVLNEFRKLQALVGQKYLYRIVIGTHFDQIGIPKSHEAYIYQYKRLQEKFSQLSEDIKMDKRVMFAISNDLKGGHIEITKAVLALYALENMVRNLDLFFRVTHQ